MSAPSVSAPISAAGRIFYGWYIAAAAVVVYLITQGVTVTLPPLLYPKLITEFNATVADVSTAGAITFLAAGLFAPLGGYLTDRYGAQRLMRVGLVLLAMCATLYPFSTALWQLYVLHALFAAALVICGIVVSVYLLSNWFVQRRGAVIGLLAAGSSFAGTLLPPLFTHIADRLGYGWRWGYGAVAALLWIVAIPLVFLVIREKPADLGLTPDGLPPTENEAAKVTGELPGVTLAEAVRTANFWWLALAGICSYYALMAVQNHLVTYLNREAKFQSVTASFYFSLMYFFSIGGKFGFGVLSDKIAKHKAAIMTSLLLFAGTIFLLRPTGGFTFGLMTNELQLTVFGILFGLGFGGAFTLTKVLVGECFGQRELGRILGIYSMLNAVAGFAGIRVTGGLQTRFGSYVIPFQAALITALAGLLCFLLINPYRRQNNVS